MQPYKIVAPSSKQVPILISVPHCGTFFPEEIRQEYKADLIQSPDDTDWFVDQLYDFAPAMGMTMITAVNSRWVIDLNRDPESKPLYTDGRIITALCPTTTFLGESLYNDKRTEVKKDEVNRRFQQYYIPYHQQIQTQLDDLKKKFGKVLLWDCHSIRQFVSTIQPGKFPDLILGDADETSAPKTLIETTLKNLGSDVYSMNHNHPFKGGTITRTFGKPSQHQYALQLEMCKVHYMDDTETRYDEARANHMRSLLQKTFNALIKELQ
jgi:N-formylglutamate amidohydrolase